MMEENIIEQLKENKQQQSIIRKKIIEKKYLIYIILTQGFGILLVVLTGIISTYLQYGLLMTIGNVGIIGFVIKKFISIDWVKKTLIEAKQLLCSHPQEELEQLQIEEVKLQQMQKQDKPQQLSKSSLIHQQILECHHLKETLLEGSTAEKNKIKVK